VSRASAHRRTPGFKVKVLLETTAGQGTSLGYRFEHLADIIKLRDELAHLKVELH